MAVLEPDSDNKNSDFIVENTAYVPSIDEAKVTDIKEEPSTTNSSELLTDQIIKKNLKETRYLHMPSIALGAGIAISCLVLGIFFQLIDGSLPALFPSFHFALNQESIFLNH